LALADFSELGIFDKRELYKNSFVNYIHRKVGSQADEKITANVQKLINFMTNRKPANMRGTFKELETWLSEMISAWPRIADQEATCEHIEEEMAVIAFTWKEAMDSVQVYNKDCASVLQQLYGRLMLLFERIDAHMTRFVKGMSKKVDKDIHNLERFYIEQVKEKVSVMNRLMEEHREKQREMEGLKQLIHLQKNKLASDYVCIKELKQELVFTREHKEIVAHENRRLEQIILEFKDNLVRRVLRSLEECSISSLISSESTRS
jgi:hypothetical protein